MTIAPENLLLAIGGRMLEQYGVLTRRTSPDQDTWREVFTRAAPANFVDRFGDTKTAAANVPRASWIDADGGGLKPYLLIDDGEVCYVPFFVGADEIVTIHTILARPSYADTGGDLGVTPSIWTLGGASLPRLACYFDQFTRIITVGFERHVWDLSRTDWPGLDSTVAPGLDATDEAVITSTAIPAGDLLSITVQYDAPNARARLNLGGAWSGYTTATSSGAIAGKWGAQRLYLGYYADALNGAIRALLVGRGAYEPSDFANWIA